MAGSRLDTGLDSTGWRHRRYVEELEILARRVEIYLRIVASDPTSHAIEILRQDVAEQLEIVIAASKAPDRSA